MSNLTVSCPWDDCQNLVAIADSAQESDVLVCRTNEQTPANAQGCNRNVEVTSLVKAENNLPVSAVLSPLAVSEDWGE
ncbi:MAG: hypothetical protein WCV73_02495 [Patescibacteria group bacterium]|jgi:hypothetical protein